jgi:hypothetical protein
MKVVVDVLVDVGSRRVNARGALAISPGKKLLQPESDLNDPNEDRDREAESLPDDYGLRLQPVTLVFPVVCFTSSN